jgi:hypothetical protein
MEPLSVATGEKAKETALIFLIMSPLRICTKENYIFKALSLKIAVVRTSHGIEND